MKIVDTVVLIGYINPLDSRNKKATEHIDELQEGELMVAVQVLWSLIWNLKPIL